MSEIVSVALDGRYSIAWDGARNWTLNERVTRKERDSGREYEDEVVLGYYGDLAALARRYLREEIGNVPMKTFADLLSAISVAEEKVSMNILKATGWPAWKDQ